MKRVFEAVLLAVIVLILPTGCKKAGVEEATQPPANPGQAATAPAPASAGSPTAVPAGRTGTVTETMDAGDYTYVQVDTGTESIWAAAPKFQVAVGDTVTVPQGMPMTDYHSETLDRDFEVVYFVPAISAGDAPAVPGDPSQMPTGHPAPSASSDPGGVDFSGLAKVEGGQTVAEIFGEKATLAGKSVKVRGKVVKFTGGIMGKNWIHLQDGTDFEGANDLTVTTSAAAAKGDTVVVSGVLVTDKDFGAGYRYDVILEDAEVTVE